MIRPAVVSDRDRCIVLLKNSRLGAGFDDPAGRSGFVFPFDPAYAERLFLHHVLFGDAVCLIHDVENTVQGLLMATACEHPFGPVRLARETVWWIEPLYRGLAAPRMLDAYEDWAEEQDCAFVGMAGMGEDPDVAKLYRRRGYTIAETHYLKAV